jgi:hypothetical protein
MSINRIRILAFCVLGLACLQAPLGSGAEKTVAGPALTGTIRGTDGIAMEGVAISAAAVGGTITTSVYSDEQGRFYFPGLPGGKYRVWAQAVGYEAGRAELELTATRATRQDFNLKSIQNFERQLTSPEWIAG